MNYKLYIGPNTWFHPKNKIGIDLLIEEKKFDIVNNIDDANIVLYISPSPPNSDRINNFDINDEKFKNKLFILGPHFSVFPTPYLQTLNVINNNIIFNLLSNWVKNYWQKELSNNLKLVTLPYPVDINKFKPNTDISKSNDVFVYIKNRTIHDALFIIDHLKNLNYNVHILNYKQRYDENYYIDVLQKSVFGIWVGCHESQGFGLQEALSCNVPLLVFDVKHMGQEENYENNQKYCSSSSTSIPYWDDRCGESFNNQKDYLTMFTVFLAKIKDYKPREYILENLSPDGVFRNYWKPTIDEFFKV